MTRLEFLQLSVCYDRWLEKREGGDCSEYIAVSGGDVCHYRVYGNKQDGYFISCK